jgi:hypothetical protein
MGNIDCAIGTLTRFGSTAARAVVFAVVAYHLRMRAICATVAQNKWPARKPSPSLWGEDQGRADTASRPVQG